MAMDFEWDLRKAQENIENMLCRSRRPQAYSKTRSRSRLMMPNILQTRNGSILLVFHLCIEPWL